MHAPTSQADAHRADSSGILSIAVRLVTSGLLLALPASPSEPPEWDGPGWYQYAQSLDGSETQAAQHAFERAHELGYRPGDAALEVARLLRRRDNTAQAIQWLLRAAEDKVSNFELELLGDPALSELSQAPLFRKAFGIRSDSSDPHIAAWQRDLSYLWTRLQQTHFDLFAEISRADLETTFDQLGRRLGDLSDSAIALELMHIASSIGDGHTFLLPPLGQPVAGRPYPNLLTMLPFQAYVFEEGVFVIATEDGHESLVGRRILEIADQPVEELLEQLSPFVSADNRFGRLANLPVLLACVDALQRIGAVPPEAEIVPLQLEASDGGSERIELAPGTGAIHFQPPLAALAGTGASAALFASRPAEFHWSQRLLQDRVSYVQLNLLVDGPRQTLDSFFSDLTKEWREQAPALVVLDLRFNGGGSSYEIPNIVKALASLTERTQLAVLTGRQTFSAAVNLVSRLEEFFDPLLIGEPTGAGPNFVGETNLILLPESGLAISASSRYHQGRMSDDQQAWWSPDVFVPPRWSEWSQGVDRALLAAFESAGIVPQEP